MFQRLKKQLPILVAALISGTAVAVGPAIAQAAYDAVNADKVDGRHAVGAGASVQQRKNKLVATSKRGRLPNNIIAKAPNADKVDGIDSDVLLDRYTKAQVDAMPFRRLLGFGSVASDGTLTTPTYFPGGASQKVGTGVYFLSLPGYGPGCVRPFPMVLVSPMFGSGEAYSGFGSMNCGSGDVSMQVTTANSAGTGADRSFGFTFFSGDSPGLAPSARQRAGADVCELTEVGVRCR